LTLLASSIVAGEEDGGDGRVAAFQLLQQGEAGLVGQADVEQHEVGEVLAQRNFRACAARLQTCVSMPASSR
jgi:hypothetical protein